MNLDFLTTIVYATPFLIVFFIWTTIWKIAALWTAASKKHFLWFLIIFFVNTLGILEILYIYKLNKYDLDNGKVLAFVEKNLAKLKRSK